MNKFILPVGFGVLLVASAVFNVVQYNQNNQTKILAEKLAFFESHFGTYESFLESQKQADAAKYKRERTINVFMKIGTSKSQILALKSLLESQSSVQSVQYVSDDQALADFKTKHQNDQLILQALNELEANPFEIMLTITITDPSQKQSLVNFIENSGKNSIISIIDKVDY